MEWVKSRKFVIQNASGKADLEYRQRSDGRVAFCRTAYGKDDSMKMNADETFAEMLHRGDVVAPSIQSMDFQIESDKEKGVCGFSNGYKLVQNLE